MKLTKLLLEYPGAFTPRPKDEWDKNQEDIKKRRDPNIAVQQYIKNGSEGRLNLGLFSSFDPDLLFSLPDNLTVNGDLVLEYCKNIKELPRYLVVKGKLDISWSGVEEVPADIYIGGTLEARSSAIKYLPKSLSLGRAYGSAGTLSLHEANYLEELPSFLRVPGMLDIQGTLVKALPDDIKVGGTINAANSDLEYIPDNLTVKGSFNLYGTKIKEIPNNLKVTNFLHLADTPLARKYTREEVRSILEEKGGYIGKEIITSIF